MNDFFLNLRYKVYIDHCSCHSTFDATILSVEFLFILDFSVTN